MRQAAAGARAAQQLDDTGKVAAGVKRARRCGRDETAWGHHDRVLRDGERARSHAGRVTWGFGDADTAVS